MALQLCLLAALVLTALAGPISYPSTPESCALSCPATPDPRYQTGQTYNYDYTSTVTTSIPGTTEDASTLTLSARAQVTVLAPCDMQLTLSGLTLSDTDPSTGDVSPVPGSAQFASAVEQKPLRFAMSNGRVDELCSEEDEPAWVLNIKRAVLSGLQSSVSASIEEPTTVTETDVVGECEVTYAPAGSTWSTTKISKKKNLLACTSRQNAQTIFQTVPYQVPSYIQSLPLLKSTHECEHQLDSSDRLTEVTCTETHTFRPFAKEESGATTQVSMSLRYTGEQEATSTSGATYSHRSSLLFEHVEMEEDVDVRRRDVVQTLRTLCTETEEDGVRAETPARFSALVKSMRQLDSETLLEVANIASNRLCTKAQKFFGDAIPSLGTTASVSVMRSLIQSGAVSGSQADLWMSSLTFINKPTKQMLAEVKPLLSVASPSKTAVLSISSLVHSYCKTNAECSSEEEVTGIMTVLESMLATDCSGDHQTTLLALKAIGNTGVAHAVVPTLNRCITNTQIPMETRITAINAFRRMPCNTNKSGLLSVMTNSVLDSELRINAYLMMMQCPTHDILSSVYTMLESEQVNQVGSFIWTHLTNLMEASSPLKQDIRNILDDSKLIKTFDLDKRKFSRNVEWSGFSEMLNSGATVDSNLIWSSKSFMPRSASVNLTVDLFGQSINLMEVGGRVEGLDSVLESFFGPEETNERTRRAAVINPSHIDDLDNKYREEVPEPRGSAYMRMFGHEISYEDFRGLDLDTTREKFNYLQWIIDLASEHNYEFTKSMVLLDSEISVPTVMGLPLKLAVDGTTVMDLKLSGKVDLRHLMSSPRSLDIVGLVRPSAALQIEASMGVDAWVARTGLKMTNTFHTSTLADGSIQLQDGKIFNMDIKMPNQQMDIFNAESKFYITHRDVQREQSMHTEGRVEVSQCFGGSLEKALGLELCGQLAFPKMTATGAPWFPFTGPASSSLVLHKRDTFNKYSLSGQMMKKIINEGTFNYLASASFNMPGSAVDRELSFNFDLNEEEHSISFAMRSPWKKMDLSGSLTNTPELRRIMGRALFDEVNEYSASAEFSTAQQRYNTRYETLVTVHRPQVDPYTFTGVVIYRPERRLEADLALKNVFSDPVTLKGELQVTGESAQTRYEGDISVRAPNLKGQLVGNLDTSRENNELLTSSSLQLKYKYGGARREELGISSRFHLQPQGERQQVSLNGATTTTMWPEYDTDLTVSLSKEVNALGASIQVGLTNDKPKRVDLTARIAHDLTTENKRIGATAAFSFPHKDMAYDLVLRHQHNMNELLSSMEFTYSGSDSVKAELELKRDVAALMMMSARASLAYPGREMAYEHSLRQSATNTYHNDLTITLDHYESIKLVSTYIRDTTHQVTAELTTPFTSPITLEGRLKPVLTNFDANVRLTSGSSEYIVASNWRHAMTRNSMDTAAALEVTYPARKVKVETSIRKAGTTISTSLITHWDMARDMSQKMTNSLQLEMSLPTPSFTLRSEWPGKFAELSGNMMVADKKEGSLHFTSSYSGYESIMTSFTHELTSTAMKTNWEISRDSQKIDVALNLNKVNGWMTTQGDLTINTPFQELSHLKIESSQTFNTNSISTESKVYWNQDQMALLLSGNADLSAHALEGEMKFTSPFSGLEFIVLKSKHNDDGRQFTTSTEATIGIGNTYSADLNMVHERDGWFITNNGEININKPIPTKLGWRHSNTDRDMNTHAEIVLATEKSEIDFNARLRKRSTISASLSSPYVPHTSFSLFHMSERRSWKNIRSTAEFTHGSNMIKAENEFSFESGKSFTLNTKFVSPFNEQVELNINNNLEGATFNAHNELTWGASQRAALTGSVTMNLPSVEGSLRLETPYTETVAVDAMTRNVDGIWEVSSTTLYGQYKVYQTLAQLAMNDVKKFHLDFSSEHPLIQQFVFDVEQTGSVRVFDTKVELHHYTLGGPLKVEFNMDTTSFTAMAANFNMESAVSGAEAVRASARNSDQSGVFEIEMTLELPQQTMKITTSHQCNNLLDFTHNTQVQYQTDKKIELDIGVSSSPKREAFITFKSPFTEDKKLMLTCAGQLSAAFSAMAEVTLTPSQKIIASTEFSQNDGIQGTASITSPFEELSLLEASFNHRGNLMAFSNGASAKLNAHHITAESEFSMAEQITGRLALKTTFDEIKDAELSLSHEGTLTKFQNEIVAVYNGERFTGTSQFEKVGTSLNGRVTVGTIQAQFQHSGELSQFQNNASIDMYGTRLSTENSFSLTGTDMSLTAKVNAPELYSLTLSHSGPISAFTNSLKFQAAEKIMTVGSEFNYGDNLKAAITAETPFDGYKNMALEYVHSGPVTDFTCNLIGNMEQSQISGQAALKMEGNTFEHSVSVSTPFSEASQFGYSLTKTGAWNNTHVQLRGNLMDAVISSSAVLRLPAARQEASFQISTPFEELQSFNINANHNGQWNNFNNHLTASYNGVQMSAESAFKLLDSIVEGHMKLMIPENSFTVDAKHTGGLMSYTNELTMSWNEQQITANSRMASTDNSIDASLNIQTPFAVCETLQATIRNSGTMTNFNNQFTVQLNGQTATGQSAFAYNGDSLEGSLDVSTPFEMLQSLKANAKHSGSMNDFNNEFMIELNGQSISGNNEYSNSGDVIRASMILNTPFAACESLKINARQSGPLNNFNNEFSAELNGQSITGNSAFMYGGNALDASLNLNTPFEMCQSLKASAKHSGSLNNFNTELLIELNEQSITGNGAFMYNGNALEASMTLNTPYEMCQSLKASIKHNGPMDNFNNEFMIELNGQSISGNSALSNTGATSQASLVISTPFAMCESLKLNVKNTGSMTNFNNEFSAELNDQTITGTSAFMYSGNSLEGSLELSTPFEMCQSLKANAKHSGSMNNFNNEFIIELNGQSISGNNQYSNNGGVVRASMILNTPFAACESLKINAHHSGSLDNFNNEFSFELNGQAITGNSAFMYSGNALEGSFNLNTPYEMCQSLRASAKHSGSLNNFNNEFSVELNGQSFTGNSAFMYSGNALEGSLNLNTPYEMCQSLRASAKHSGSLNNFNNEFSVELNGQSLTGNSAFIYSGNSLEGSLNLNTPYEMCQSFKASAKHSGSSNNFNNEFSMELNGQVATGKSAFMYNGNAVERSLELATPFEAIQSFKANAKHSGSISNFNNEFLIELNDQTANGNSAFMYNENSIDGSLNLNTPFEKCSSFKASIKHSGSMHNFNNELSTELNGEAVTYSSAFSYGGNAVEGSMDLTTPFTMCQSMKASAKLTGIQTNFTAVDTQVLFELNGERFTSNNAYSIGENNVKASVDIQTPFETVNKVKGSVSHSGPWYNFNNGISAELNDQAVAANLEFKLTKRKVQLTLTGTSPSHSVSFKAKHAGIRLNSLENEVEASYNGQSIRAGSQFSLSGNELRASLNANAASNNFLATIEHNGGLSNFNNIISASLNGESIDSTTAFKLEGSSVESSYSLRTPFSQVSSAAINLNLRGQPSQFTHSLSMSLNEHTISSGAEFEMSNGGIEGSVRLSTPFSMLESTTLSFSHRGPATDMTNELSASYNGKVMRIVNQFVLDADRLDGSLRISGPIDVVITAKHSGAITDFKNELSASVHEQTISSDITFRLTDNNMEGQITLSSPVGQFFTSAKHEGPLNNFKNEIVVSVNEKRIDSVVEFKLTGTTLEGSMTFTSPIFTFSTSANHEGSLNNFNNQLRMAVNEHTITFNNQFRLIDNELDATFSVNTAFGQITLASKHTGSLTNFNNEMSASLNDLRIASNVEFRLEGNNMDGSVQLTSPLGQLRITTKHVGPINHFTHEWSLALNEETVHATVEFRLQGNDLDASLRFASAIMDLYMTSKHTGPINDFRNEMTITVNEQSVGTEIVFKYTDDKIEFTTAFTSPFGEISIQSKHFGDMMNFNNGVVAAVNGQSVSSNMAVHVNGNEFETSSTFTTPFGRLSLEAKHSGTLVNFNNQFTVSLDDQSIRSESEFMLVDDVMRGSLQLTTPFGNFNGQTRHNGPINDFTNVMSVAFNDNNYESRIEFSVEGTKVEGLVRLTSPLCTSSFSLNHDGPIHSFTNAISATLNEKRFSSNIEFSISGNNIETAVTIAGPVYLEFTGKHAGVITDFQNEMSITLGGRKSDSSVAFKLDGNTVETTIAVETPFDTMQFSGKHTGIITDFQNEFTSTLNGETTSYNGQFRLNGNDLQTQMRFSSPSTQLSGNVRQSGTITNFRNEITGTWNEQTLTSVATFLINGANMENSLAITTPTRSINWNAKHDGQLTNFNNEFILTINGQMMKSVNQFRKTENSIDGSARIETPYSSYRTMALSVSHDGVFPNMETEIRADVEGAEIVARTSVKKVDSRIETLATLQTPADTYAVSYIQEGTLTNFNQEASVTVNQQVTSVRTVFKKDSQIEASIEIASPFSGLTHGQLSVVHTGTLMNFKNTAMLKINSNTYTADVEFRKEGNTLHFMSGVQIPQEYSLTLDHTGPWTQFTNSLTIKAAEKTMSHTVHFSTSEGRVDISIDAVTPITNLERMSMTYSHEGSLANFKQQSQVTYGEKTIRHGIEFGFSGRRLNGKIELATPFTDISSFALNFAHRGGRWNNYVNSASVELNGNTHSAESKIKVFDKKTIAEFIVKLPQEYSVALTRKGSLNDFTANVKVTLDQEILTSNMAFKKTEAVYEGSFNVHTPYESFRDFGIEFSHTNKQSWKTSGSLITPLEFLPHFAFELSHEGTPSQFSTSARFETPIAAVPTINFQATHQGGLGNFANSISLEFADRRYAAESAFVNDNTKVKHSASLQTPHQAMTDMSYSFIYTKAPQTSFVAEAVLNGERVEGDLSITTTPNFQFTANLKTPFQGARNINLNANHQGRLTDFTTTASFQIDGRRNAVTFAFKKTGTVIESSGSLETPVSGYEHLTFNINHNGGLSDFTSTGNFVIDGQRTALTVTFKKTGAVIESTASLETPYPGYEQIRYTLNHNGGLSDFTTTESLEIDGRRIAMTLQFKKTGAVIQSSGNLVTPYSGYEQIDFNFDHNGAPSNLRTVGSITTPSGNFVLNLEHSGTLANFRSTVQLETPYTSPLSSVITHQGSLNDFSCTANVQYAEQRIAGELSFKHDNNNMEGALTLNTPFAEINDLRVNMQHSQPSQSLTGKTEIIYNGVQLLDIDYNVGTGAVKSVAINMAAPKRVVLTGNFNMAATAITSEANINYEGTQYSASFELQDMKDLTVTVAIPEHNVRLSSKFEMNAESFAHQTEVIYNNDESKKVSYDIEVTRSSRGRQNIYDGRVVLTNRLGSLRTTFNHKVNPGRRYLTEVNVQDLLIRSDVLLKQVNGREFTTTFTAQHPSFTKDVKLSIEGAIEPEKPRIEGKVTLEYSNQAFELTAKIADESMSGNDRKYVAEAHLSHPASALDVQFSSALTNNMESMGGNMEVSYMMAKDRQVKNTALRAQINKIREELNMELSTPEKSMSVSGRRSQGEETDAPQTYTVSGNLGDRNMHAELELDQASPSIDMKLHYNPEEMLHVYGKYLDPSTIKLEAYHEKDGGRLQDTELSLRLSNKRILNARAFARPTIIDDLQYFFSGESEIGTFLRQVSTSVSQEAIERLESFQTALAPLHQSASELQQVVADKYQVLHQNNDLFVRDIAGVVESYYASFSEKMSIVCTEYEQHFSRTWATLESHMTGLHSMMEAFASCARDAITTHGTNLMERYNHHRSNVENMIMSTVDVLRNHPSVESLHPATLYSNARQAISDYSDWAMEATSEWRRAARDMYEDVMSRPYLSDIKEHIDTSTQNMNWVYELLEVDDVVKSWIEFVGEHGWQSVRDLAIQHLEAQASLMKFEVISWEPSQGLAEVMLTLPIEMQNLRTMPDLQITERFNSAVDMVDTHMPSLHVPNLNLWDTFYAYKPSMNPEDWIPPFSTHATLAGNQHFMTFDKKFYEFAGDCSYLLARDFIDGKFSVIANYENGIKRSLSILADNTQIEIQPTFKVIVNEVNTELPITVGSTTVRRIANTVRVDNAHGVTVICDLPHDRCTVNMTGWYFGKTGGLFGTYDYEPSNDMTTSERRLATSTEQFTKSWSLGENCQAVNHAQITAADDESNPRYRQCARLFVEDDSPFRVCFRQVNTSAFMSMCMNDNSEQSVCNVAAFYMDECNRAGVPVRMPKDCVTCDMADGRNMIEGESITLNSETVTKSADIVFAVSHRACNQEVLGRLGDLAEQIERNLNAAGLQDNLFGLVGYADAGELAQAHSHTFNGQLMGSLAVFSEGLNNLEVNEQASEDALNAVQFAANYPFRAGVSKVIILVPCDSCQDMSTSYREVRQMLASRSIQLHTLARHNFVLRTETPKTSFIFGVDGRTLFTGKDVKSSELTGDTALRRQVAMPTDLCSSLAEQTDGSFFNIGQMLDTRPTTQKRFLDVFTRLVVKKAAPSDCQKCECLADSNGRGTPVCRKCEAENSYVLPWSQMDLPEPDLNVEQIVADARRPIVRPRERRGRRLRN